MSDDPKLQSIAEPPLYHPEPDKLAKAKAYLGKKLVTHPESDFKFERHKPVVLTGNKR